MRVTSVESTEIFTGTPEKPLQVVVVRAEHIPGRPVLLTVEGPGVRSVGELPATAGEDGTVRAEVPVSAERLAPGDRRRITVTVEDAGAGLLLHHSAEFTAVEPGRTTFMDGHLHHETGDTADDPAGSGRPAHCDPVRRGPLYCDEPTLSVFGEEPRDAGRMRCGGTP
ncbi:hypothetical protein ACWGKQ_51690 [Streptomyces sp. NPDC054770]